jgi:hypothetical protein
MPFFSGAFWYAWQTILIVLLIVVGGPWWLWRVVLYIRKKANTPVDLELLLYGFLAAIDVLSATLVMVLLVVSHGFNPKTLNPQVIGAHLVMGLAVSVPPLSTELHGNTWEGGALKGDLGGWSLVAVAGGAVHPHEGQHAR